MGCPAWLVEQVTPDWFERYSRPLNEYRLPKNETKQAHLAQTVGQDGSELLSKIYTETKLSWLQNLKAIEILRQVWIQQYYNDGQQVQACMWEFIGEITFHHL